MKKSSRTIGGMCVLRRHTNNMISSISSSSSSTWRLASVFALVLVLTSLSSATGEVSSGVVSFTPSKALAQDNANNSPIGKSSHQCDPSTYVNGKEVVSCRDYTTIPTDIPNKHEIQTLDMSKGNYLQTLEDGELLRANLPMLTKLNLQNSRIYTIQRGAFKGGNIIVELDLSSNNMEVLDPEVFLGLDNMRILSIRNNPINRFLPDTVFPSLRQINTLDLSNCELDHVPTDIFTNLGKLEKLSFKDNRLNTLDWKVLNPTTTLHTLDLNGNRWYCDCHIKFLIDHLRERGIITTVQQATCASVAATATSSGTTSKSLAGMKWEHVPMEALACRPEIKTFQYISYDVLPPGTKAADDPMQYEDDDDRDKSNVKLGQDVYFECEYSGYPRPEIGFSKDGKPIKFDESARAMPSAGLSPLDVKKENNNNQTHPANLDDSPSTPSPLIQKAKFEVQDGTFRLGGKSMDGNDEDIGKRYKFRKNLILRRVKVEDKGGYECIIWNSAGTAHKTAFLNLTGVGGDDFFLGGIGGGKKRVAIWMWILAGILIALIFVLLVLCVWLVWRRKEKKKQQGFRKVIQEKFKDSNVDLGDLAIMKTTSSNQLQKSPDRSEGAVPLLGNGSEHSTVLINDTHQQAHLPDVALGNAELLRNSQIFSPKPPPAHIGYPVDARKEFFARQISEPYFRPGSAMSLTRPGGMDASNRRYIFANQHYPTAPVPGGAPDQENMYAVPDHVRTLPRFGSAMSMSALADSDVRRQMFLRQYSQPQPPYATAMRYHPHRRPPSTSSESQVDNTMMGAYNYSTLPRRPIRLQNWSRPVSPTGSTCSSYSTLSWRPMANSMGGTVSDGVGPRRDALGGSTASLSRTPELTGSLVGVNGGGLESMNRAMVTPTNPGKVKNIGRNPRMGHSRTPSSLTRGHNDFFSFEPIQEVESSASNLNLEKMNGRQTPSEYSTQSLAREPMYKKKKPPPIAFNPATLKAPSRAFDHFKGRSVSPANRNGSIANAPTRGSNPSIGELVKNDANANNSNGVPNRNIQVPILESPIDEVPPSPREEITEVPPPNNRLSKSGLVPPPPPPKPKRSQTPEEKDENEFFNSEQNNLNMPESEIPIQINDGTVV